MTNLKDQIAEQIRKERGGPEKAEQKVAETAETRLDQSRPALDEMPHSTDNYRLNLDYAKGPYAETIAVIELEETDGTWVAWVESKLAS